MCRSRGCFRLLGLGHSPTIRARGRPTRPDTCVTDERGRNSALRSGILHPRGMASLFRRPQSDHAPLVFCPLGIWYPSAGQGALSNT